MMIIPSWSNLARWVGVYVATPYCRSYLELGQEREGGGGGQEREGVRILRLARPGASLATTYLR